MFSCEYNTVKFLRTPVLTNTCERLFERFEQITQTTGSEENIFSKRNNITSNSKWRKIFLSASWKKLAFTWGS